MDKATTDLIVMAALRWIHFLAGVTWIGHLYFFNLVNGPFTKTLDAETKKKVVPQLMPRALWWFRWGAMVTFLSGLGYLVWKEFVAGTGHLTGADGQTPFMQTAYGQWISLGALFGTVMWFNVWFIIWPAQKKLIGWTARGENPPEMAGLARRAFLASRTNTYLSVPLLFSMGAASHFPQMSWVGIVAVLAIGFGLAYYFIEQVSPNVGKTV